MSSWEPALPHRGHGKKPDTPADVYPDGSLPANTADNAAGRLRRRLRKEANSWLGEPAKKPITP